MCLATESRWRWDHSRFSFVPALYNKLKFWYSNIGSFNGYSKLRLGVNFKAHRSFCWRRFVSHLKLFIWNCFSVTNLRLVRGMLIRAGTRYFSSAVSVIFLLSFWSSGSLHYRRVWLRSWTTPVVGFAPGISTVYAKNSTLVSLSLPCCNCLSRLFNYFAYEQWDKSRIWWAIVILVLVDWRHCPSWHC